MVFLCTAIILSSGDFIRVVGGEVFPLGILGFRLPKHFLVFSFGLHAFSLFPYCFIFDMSCVA